MTSHAFVRIKNVVLWARSLALMMETSRHYEPKKSSSSLISPSESLGAAGPPGKGSNQRHIPSEVVKKLVDVKPPSNLEDLSESDDNDVDIDDADDGELFARSLNGIILQYFESCGLLESYTTFYDECCSSGMLIPSNYKPELEKGISLQDVETLLVHYDQENGEALLELWEVLIATLDENENRREVEKITFYIQVYIALIPYRQKMSEERKTSSMKQLRDYFEKRSEACTIDNEMSSLFALPFVPDPESHPVFGELFQIAWVKKLRSRIKDLARSLCSPNRLITRDKTDLAKMFIACASAVPHDITSADGKTICILTNTQPVEFTSGVEIPASCRESLGLSNKDDFSPSELFQRMNDLILENERYKKEESKFEQQCAQLLNVSLLLASSLEDAAEGKEVNMDKLRYELNQCLPVAVHNSEGSTDLTRSGTDTARISNDGAGATPTTNVNQNRYESFEINVTARKPKPK